ncbi:MAG TPA: GNAT family N-acetyltransferase [Kineosporiaceae bacterium]|nr:GNAT family N-acetyltransferase [Kineosporiaceae bacterium]
MATAPGPGPLRWSPISPPDLPGRPRGTGASLTDWRLRRAAEIAAARRAELGAADPGWVTLHAGERPADADQVTERAGLRVVGAVTQLRRDLTRPVPAVPVPRGLLLAGYSPQLDEAICRAHDEAFADRQDVRPSIPPVWTQARTWRTAFRADCSFVVLDGDEIAGYAVSEVHPHPRRPTGPAQGRTQVLGVRPAWRGRGVAKVLLTATLRAFQAADLAEACLDTDSGAPAGGRDLYRGLGYRLRARQVVRARRV